MTLFLNAGLIAAPLPALEAKIPFLVTLFRSYLSPITFSNGLIYS